MTKPLRWKTGCIIIAICAATSIAAPAQTLTTLVDFIGRNGSFPAYGSLAQGLDGNLYGTTNGGPTIYSGVIFRIAQNPRRFQLLFTSKSFMAPDSGVVLGTNGNFYGTTYSGGANGGGTIFKLTPQGEVVTMYNFCPVTRCVDGDEPIDIGGLIEGVDGNFYGTTQFGGSSNCFDVTLGYGCGTVFRITPAGAFTTLHIFSGYPTDGSYPASGLIQATDGNFYGTTVYGGQNNAAFCDLTFPACGTVFRITPTGAFTTVYNFVDGNDGAQPTGNLIEGLDGNLYGTTFLGGCSDDFVCGTVFKITLGGQLTPLFGFCVQEGCNEGAGPQAGLIQGTDGNFYGTTTYGGTYGKGTIFKITPDGQLTPLYSFCAQSSCRDGAGPEAALVQGTNGTFYGTTADGGTTNQGTLFSLSMGFGPFVTFVRSYGKVGQTGGILGQGFTGTTNVSLNGIPAAFTVVSDTYMTATVPPGATTGYVKVATPSGTLTSNVPFRVIP
jgi:uncharacterized repeat protein (TIGR03803 family)